MCIRDSFKSVGELFSWPPSLLGKNPSLDVYKRQVRLHDRGGGSWRERGHIPQLSLIHIFQGAMKERKESIREVILTDVCPFTLGTEVAVSYTHLDVYKRQQRRCAV